MNRRDIWEKGDYFKDFESFDETIVYIPSVLSQYIVRIKFPRNVSAEEFYLILGLILRYSFRPPSPNHPPLGYCSLSIKKISDELDLTLETVTKALQYLLDHQIVNRDEYIWINHPDLWEINLEQKLSEISILDSQAIKHLLGL